MASPAQIFTLAPAIARGAEVPEVDPEARREVGRLIDKDPEGALSCLDAVLVGHEVSRALLWLESIGALGVWLPEVQALVDFHKSSPVHHKDLWTHTLEVTQRTPAEADLRWVALLHDVGKVATRHVYGAGLVSFHGHERLGAWLAQGIAARFGMSPSRRERIAFIIEHHARVNAYERTWTERAVRRLVRDAGEHLDDMLRFSGADYTTKRPRQVNRIRSELAELRTRITALRAEASAINPLPPRLGKTLCESLALSPGPEVGQAIAWLVSEVEAGRLEGGLEASYYLEALKRERASAAQKG